MAQRSRIVLECAEGHSIMEVSRRLQITADTVRIWRRRFIEWGLDEAEEMVALASVCRRRRRQPASQGHGAFGGPPALSQSLGGPGSSGRCRRSSGCGIGCAGRGRRAAFSTVVRIR
ncbi:helix-turn-helix domain-containing protein [Streptomyces zaomyceticus]|uniref:helix-turn-helix domain-containing protein n=1 Tax=Streptomyces zaomyceticus TaxID=68286 RepID=UPI0034165CCA